MKGKNDVLFSLVCIWAVIFFSAVFVTIEAAASHSEWVLTHSEKESEENAATAFDDEAVEAYGGVETEANEVSAGHGGGRNIAIASIVVAASGAAAAVALLRKNQKE